MSSKLYVTCYRFMATDHYNRLIAAPMAPPVKEMWLEIDHENNVSDPFPEFTTFVGVKATSDCALAFGKDPVADPNFHLIEAGELRFYGVEVGQRIAVIGVVQ